MCGGLLQEEREYYEQGIAALTPEQQALLTEVDRLQIVRG
jgi:hypothetical protein